MRDLRRDAQQPVQFLLFSATFNERIKNYALRVTADDGKEEVNQVSDFHQIPYEAFMKGKASSACSTAGRCDIGSLHET